MKYIDVIICWIIVILILAAGIFLPSIFMS